MSYEDETEKISKLVFNQIFGISHISASDIKYLEDVSLNNEELYNAGVTKALAARNEFLKAKKFISQEVVNEGNLNIYANCTNEELNDYCSFKAAQTGNVLFEKINSEDTFSIIVSGDSMTGAKIFSGDIVFAKRGVELTDGDITAVLIMEELFIKRLRIINGELWLYSENSNYAPYRITDISSVKFFGKVFASLRAVE